MEPTTSSWCHWLRVQPPPWRTRCWFGCPTWLDLPEHHHPSASHLSKTREKTEVERHRLSGHEGWSKQDSSFNFQLCVNHQLNHILRQTGLVMQLLWNSRCRWDWSELPERLSVRLGHCVCVCVFTSHTSLSESCCFSSLNPRRSGQRPEHKVVFKCFSSFMSSVFDVNKKHDSPQENFYGG